MSFKVMHTITNAKDPVQSSWEITTHKSTVTRQQNNLGRVYTSNARATSKTRRFSRGTRNQATSSIRACWIYMSESVASYVRSAACSIESATYMTRGVCIQTGDHLTEFAAMNSKLSELFGIAFTRFLINFFRTITIYCSAVFCQRSPRVEWWLIIARVVWLAKENEYKVVLRCMFGFCSWHFINCILVWLS